MKNRNYFQYLLNAVRYSDKNYKVLKDLFLDGKGYDTCWRLAYGDMARRTFSWDGNIPDCEKASWKEQVANDILLPKTKKLPDAAGFDKWHEETCRAIVDQKHSSLKTLTYGHAQKWLNMMLKNMLVCNIDEKINTLLGVLHVPVDSYVLNAAYFQLGIRTVMDAELTSEERLKVKGECYSWSQIPTYELYMGFQEKVREAITHREDYEQPILWEFDAWISGGK